jgi:carboxypeptidase D
MTTWAKPIREVGLHDDFLDERYYNTTEIEHLLYAIEKQHPTLARVHEIGQSSMGRNILAIEITTNVGHSRRILKPMFKYIANMHGDETVGLQLLLYLAQYLTLNYGRDDRISRIVDSTDIYLMPTLNPDGYFASNVLELIFWIDTCQFNFISLKIVHFDLS